MSTIFQIFRRWSDRLLSVYGGYCRIECIHLYEIQHGAKYGGRVSNYITYIYIYYYKSTTVIQPYILAFLASLYDKSQFGDINHLITKPVLAHGTNTRVAIQSCTFPVLSLEQNTRLLPRPHTPVLYTGGAVKLTSGHQSMSLRADAILLLIECTLNRPVNTLLRSTHTFRLVCGILKLESCKTMTQDPKYQAAKV
jgi:hypothetical protein